MIWRFFISEFRQNQQIQISRIGYKLKWKPPLHSLLWPPLEPFIKSSKMENDQREELCNRSRRLCSIPNLFPNLFHSCFGMKLGWIFYTLFTHFLREKYGFYLSLPEMTWKSTLRWNYSSLSVRLTHCYSENAAFGFGLSTSNTNGAQKITLESKSKHVLHFKFSKITSFYLYSDRAFLVCPSFR